MLGLFDIPKKPDVKRVMNNKKVSDHHAIIPTMEITDSKVKDLKEADEKILFMIAIRMLAATDEDHIFTEIHADVNCGDETFTAKGKSIKQYGWKLYDECFKNKDRLAMQDIDEVGKESLPQLEEGQVFRRVSAEKTEHYTSPPKAFNEDLLLHAMESAGNKEFDDETEKKGLGTPATRAGIIEKLVHDKYISRKGKNLVSTEDGKALVSVMPDCLKSASMTAEWENQLLQMEKGQMDPEMFMRGITNLVSMMLNDLEILPAEESDVSLIASRLESVLHVAVVYMKVKRTSIAPIRNAQKEPVRESITFYVAECIEFPVMGEYHEGLTLEQAIEAYEKIPAGRMNGVKGIGFDLQEGSIYSGQYELFAGGKVCHEVLDMVDHYKKSPLVQDAVKKLDTFSVKKQEKQAAVSKGEVKK